MLLCKLYEEKTHIIIRKELTFEGFPGGQVLLTIRHVKRAQFDYEFGLFARLN